MKQKICQKCNKSYNVDIDDYIELCHDCYLKANKHYNDYKKNFYKYHDNSCKPVCFSEFCNNEFMELF